MENREAIEALRDLLDTTREYPHLDGMTMFGDAIELAIAALEKQETAKIVVGKSKGGVTLWHECSKCGEPVDAKDTFCRKCGRKLIYETE